MDVQSKRDYDNRRRGRRRRILMAALDDACARCGATEALDFDHVDPTAKLFEVSRGILRPWPTLLAELAKCQLLCRPCHLLKSTENGDNGSVKHGGGVSGKKNCPCAPCRARKAEYMRAYMKARRQARPAS